MSTTIDESAFGHHTVDLGSVRLHYVETGAGPLVLLLHGFPEAWFSYRWQMLALAGAGYRAVAVDLRGYNLSDKPRGIGSYTLDRLTRDIAQLIRACGAERATVVGHDWGAVVAWVFAMRFPERLEKLAILNGPHPAWIVHPQRLPPAQWLRSWYVLFFQLPWLPERLLRAGGCWFLRRTLARDPVRPGALGAEEIARYVQAWRQPGALTAGLNYYRALLKQSPPRLLRRWLRPIEAPVVVIWGEQDRYLVPRLAVPPPAPPPGWVPRMRVERLPNASHWVQNDRPDEVNRLLLAFLGPPGAA
jgi:epoxide hydrolase 4